MRRAELRVFLRAMDQAVRRLLEPPGKGDSRAMPEEIKLKRKYTDVTNGHLRSPATTGVAKKKRIEKTPRDRELAEASRRRPVPVMHLLANGKKRMRRPD